MANSVAEIKPYRRWLDHDEDDIEKKLAQCIQENSTAEKKHGEKTRFTAMSLLNTVKSRDYEDCENLIAEIRQDNDWPYGALTDKIEKWLTAGKILEAIEAGSRAAYDLSGEAVNRLEEEAKNGGIGELNQKELRVTVMKKGLSVDKKAEKPVNETRKECTKLIRAAETGNAWAYDGLVNEIHKGNEMVIIPLIQRARYEYGSRKEEKEPVSFGALATAYQDMLWQEIGRRIRGADQDTKLECFTETMYRAWKALWSYEHKGSFAAWLKLVLARVIADYFTEEDAHGAKGVKTAGTNEKTATVSLYESKEGTDLELKDTIADPGQNMDDRYAKGQLVKDLMACIEKLPAPQRQAIHLFYFPDQEVMPDEMSAEKKYKKNEWTYADIAKVQGTEEKTIRKRIYNAKQKIREMLEDIGYDSGTVVGMLN